jgi:hypothetical protein
MAAQRDCRKTLFWIFDTCMFYIIVLAAYNFILPILCFFDSFNGLRLQAIS